MLNCHNIAMPLSSAFDEAERDWTAKGRAEIGRCDVAETSGLAAVFLDGMGSRRQDGVAVDDFEADELPTVRPLRLEHVERPLAQKLRLLFL